MGHPSQRTQDLQSGLDPVPPVGDLRLCSLHAFQQQRIRSPCLGLTCTCCPLGSENEHRGQREQCVMEVEAGPDSGTTCPPRRQPALILRVKFQGCYNRARAWRWQILWLCTQLGLTHQTDRGRWRQTLSKDLTSNGATPLISWVCTGDEMRCAGMHHTPRTHRDIR